MWSKSFSINHQWIIIRLKFKIVASSLHYRLICIAQVKLISHWYSSWRWHWQAVLKRCHVEAFIRAEHRHITASPGWFFDPLWLMFPLTILTIKSSKTFSTPQLLSDESIYCNFNVPVFLWRWRGRQVTGWRYRSRILTILGLLMVIVGQPTVHHWFHPRWVFSSHSGQHLLSPLPPQVPINHWHAGQQAVIETDRPS